MSTFKNIVVSFFAAAASFASASGVTPNGLRPTPGDSFSTKDVACDISHKDYSPSASLESRYKWTCSNGKRLLSGNSIPDHAVGEFPNRENPHRIAEQNVAASMPLTPTMSASATRLPGGGSAFFYALNSVTFEPGTAGACPIHSSTPSDCSRARSDGPWRMEALSQNVFNFGEDMNKAHLQPNGAYHYHGVPEGLLQNAGVSDANKRMLLVGWAIDGFPIYARYCHADAMDLSSDIKVCEGSYKLDTAPDRGRPSTQWAPLGAFTSDWSYEEGTGDLDECNGRFGATPEFPEGIYYYMASDGYPFFSRCIKGVAEIPSPRRKHHRAFGRRH